MTNRKRTRVSVERANAETVAVATPEIPGGYPDLTASQLDLIRERSTETVVDPGASLANAGDVDYDFVLVEAGDVEVVRFAAIDLGSARPHPRAFHGDGRRPGRVPGQRRGCRL